MTIAPVFVFVILINGSDSHLFSRVALPYCHFANLKIFIELDIGLDFSFHASCYLNGGKCFKTAPSMFLISVYISADV